MNALTLIAIAALTAAPLHKDNEQAVLKSYRELTPLELVMRTATELPEGFWTKVDASERIRSISFGYSTTLWVGDGVFYVEYGRSTNAPGRLMGPFRIQQ
jgi:hypothetical protein